MPTNNYFQERARVKIRKYRPESLLILLLLLLRLHLQLCVLSSPVGLE